MNNPGPQTQQPISQTHPAGSDIHGDRGLWCFLDADIIRAVREGDLIRAVGLVDDAITVAEEREPEFVRKFEGYEEVFRESGHFIRITDDNNRPDLRQHSRLQPRTTVTSTKSTPVSGRFYCRTCDDILPTHEHGQW